MEINAVSPASCMFSLPTRGDTAPLILIFRNKINALDHFTCRVKVARDLATRGIVAFILPAEIGLGTAIKLLIATPRPSTSIGERIC
jgi:hypothetical protein